MKFKWILSWKGFEIPTVGIIIFLVVTIWSLGLIIAPLTLPPNSVKDLTGTVGTIENQDITKNMNPYAKHYYEAGDFNCHTIKERSFFINGNQMPFCARDVAIFFGIALGLGIALFKTFPLKWWWLVGGLIPIGVDGGLQLVTSYESNNLFRLLTGGLAGLVTALALGFVVYDISKMAEMKRISYSEPQSEEKTTRDLSEGRKPTRYLGDKEAPTKYLGDKEAPIEEPSDKEEPRAYPFKEEKTSDDMGSEKETMSNTVEKRDIVDKGEDAKER